MRGDAVFKDAVGARASSDTAAFMSERAGFFRRDAPAASASGEPSKPTGTPAAASAGNMYTASRML